MSKPSGTLPSAAPRGPPPAGVRLETRARVGELLVADADYEVGDLVLRERFLLLGPTELPPLDMFSPVPPEVGDVVMQGEGFPGVSSWDHLHLKLLFEFANADDDVQAEALRMQDEMCAGETCQSIENVARWLADCKRPWLADLSFHDIFRLLRLFCVNSYPCRAAGGPTSGLLKWGTMINHSCCPNVTFHSVRVGDQCEGRYRAVRAIRKGDVLGSSYMKPCVGLTSLVQRRRVLWCLKGFVCGCERCCDEALHGDNGRLVNCTSCEKSSEGCRLKWQCHPSAGSFAFVGQNCGRVAGPADVMDEAKIAAEVTWAFFRHWQSFEEANAVTTDLRHRTMVLPKDHFARQGLEALLLSLEGEFLVSAHERMHLTAAKANQWLLKVLELKEWVQRVRKEPENGLVLFLAFGGLAPSVHELAALACSEGESAVQWLMDLDNWAKTMVDLDASCAEVESSSEVEFHNATFEPGGIGVEADWQTGEVTRVYEDSQGEVAGVKTGMYFAQIDAAAYTESFLDEKMAGVETYTVAFSMKLFSQ